MAQIDPTGTRHDLLGDGLGSVRSISDSSGAVVGSADYTMFGEYRNQSGVTSRFGFTGEYFAEETGMWHLRARDLHPALGRFLSADPVSPNAPGTQGYNRYAYVANNPSTWVDPSGYSVEPSPADMAALSLMNATSWGLAQYFDCFTDPICKELWELVNYLGSDAAGFANWSADLLVQAFSTYPHEPKPASPAEIAFSLTLSNTPVAGDIYDLITGVTGYDFVTGQYVGGWERAVTLIGVLPIVGVAGANMRHGMRWLDDVYILSRTGIWGGTIRRIAGHLPEGVTIGVRGRPMLAGIYEVIGWYEPKPSLASAEDLAKLKWFGGRLDSGRRLMRRRSTGKEFIAHSDIDLQFAVRNGRVLSRKYILDDLIPIINNGAGKEILQHGDNLTALPLSIEGATIWRQDEVTHLISSTGYSGTYWGFDALKGIISEGQWPIIAQILSGRIP